MSTRMHLNALPMNCPTPQKPGLWKHPWDEQGKRYTDLDHWQELARLLERGGFDTLFFADEMGTYDTFRNDIGPTVKYAINTPINDPLLPLPAMAACTEHLGLAATITTSYYHPYIAARKMSTLDHLTDGRFAWNIVTSYDENSAKNMGMAGMLSHDERYERAEEFMEVCYGLFEESWEDDAVVRDVETDTYAHPERVHKIHHEGEYFSVPGPHPCEPSPQRTPLLFQAGQSDRGRDFAAKHAEVAFTIQLDVESLRGYVEDVRQRTEKFGRSPDDIAVSAGIIPVVGETQDEAERKKEQAISHMSLNDEAILAKASGHFGVDLSEYDPDAYLDDLESEGMRGMLQRFQAIDSGKRWTIREAAKVQARGTGCPEIVGTPESIADELEYMMDEGGVDGFTLQAWGIPSTYRDFVNLVVPELRRRGLVREEYDSNTLRETMTGRGPRLPSSHPGTA